MLTMSRCFFDIVIGGLPCGRIIFELFDDVVPKTSENFRGLCVGDRGLGKTTNKRLTYNGVIFHRVVKDFIIQAGDFSNGNGTGGESIYGGTFEDENFVFKHDQPFLLSMANRAKNTNGSQFFITTQPAPHLDNIHVVFGRVVGGIDVVQQIENLSVDKNSRPLQDVRIGKCGELVRQIKVAKKKKHVESSNEENASDEEERSSSKKKHKKEKKKEKRKERKTDLRRAKQEVQEEVEPREELHPLVSVSNINPDDIPDVPVNKFLLRGDSRNFINRNRYNDRDGGRGGFNRFGNNRDWSYNNRRDGRDHRKPQITKSGRTIKGRGVFRFRTPSRSRSRSRSATPVHWRKEEARVIKLSDYEKQDGLVKPPNTVASTVAVVQVVATDETKQTSSRERYDRQTTKDKSMDRDRRDNDDEDKIDYNALDYEDEQQDMRQHLLEKRNRQQQPKLVQYPIPGQREENREAEDREKRAKYSPINENSQVMLSNNKKSDVLAMALGVQVKTGEDPPTGDFRISGFDKRNAKQQFMMQQQQQQQQQMGGDDWGAGENSRAGGRRQMSPGMEAAMAVGNKTVMSSVRRRDGTEGVVEQAAQNIKERERLLHQRLMAMAGNITTVTSPSPPKSIPQQKQMVSRSGGRSRSKDRHYQHNRGAGERRDKYHTERRDIMGGGGGRDRRREGEARERRVSGGDRDRRGEHSRSGQVRSIDSRRKSRSKSRTKTPPMRGRRHSSGGGGGSPRGAQNRNGTTKSGETHTPSPDRGRLALKAEQILLLKKKMEAEIREQLLKKQQKQEAEKEQQRILLEKQRKAKEEAEMLDRAKRAQRNAAEKEKLLKTVKALKELDAKKIPASKSGSSSATGKKKPRSKRSPSSSSSSSSYSSSSTSSSDSSVDRKSSKARRQKDDKDDKKYDKSRRR